MIHGITYTNHSQPYSLKIVLNIYVSSQFHLAGNKIMQIICTSFYSKL